MTPKEARDDHAEEILDLIAEIDDDGGQIDNRGGWK